MGKGGRKAGRPKDWSYEDHLIAFNLYCQLPFGQLHHRNPRIIELANLLGRTPGSVSMKLGNFASLDPALRARGISGLPNISSGITKVWEEFSENPERVAFESERLLAERLGESVEQTAQVDERDLPVGAEREAIVRLRVNQSFFRRRILSAYEYRCCVTGINVPELLVASHIVPWSADPKNRLNPRNGLCLNALHDRAFDRGLMWIDDDYRVRFTTKLKYGNSKELSWLIQFEGLPLQLPKQFSPDRRLLQIRKMAAVGSENSV